MDSKQPQLEARRPRAGGAGEGGLPAPRQVYRADPRLAPVSPPLQDGYAEMSTDG